MTEAMNTIPLIIPGCAERGTTERSVSVVMNYIDVADYLRIPGDQDQARRGVKALRQSARLQGFRVGKEIVYAFEEVAHCLNRLRNEKPA